LYIRGAASQTANLQEWQNSAGTVLWSVTAGGRIVGASGTSGALFDIKTGGGVGASIQSSFSTQTSNLLQLLNSSSTVLGGRNANAQIFTGSTTSITSNVGGATTAASGDGTTATLTMTSATNLAVGDIVVVAGVTPTGYNTTGSVVTAVSNSGTFTVSYANATTGSHPVAGTVSTPAQASITPRSAGTIGLIVKGVASQATNLQEWQNSSGTTVARISSNGLMGAFAGFSTASSTNTLINGTATGVGGGLGILAIGNVVTVPSSNPTGGGVLYVEAGALKHRGSGGLVTTIAGATSTSESTYASLASANAFTVGGHTITQQDDVTVGLAIKRNSASSTYLQTWGGTSLISSVTANGAINAGTLGGALGTAVLSVVPLNAGSVAQIIRAFASQNANLLEIQNNFSGIISGINPAGQIWTGRSVPSSTPQVQTISGISSTQAIGSTTITYTTSSNHGLSANQYIQIQGSSQSLHNISGSVVSVANNTTFTLTGANNGTAGILSGTGGVIYMPASLSSYAATLNTIPLVVQAANNATATVTAASGNGTTITYTCANNFLVGYQVSITGLTTTTGDSLNLSNVVISAVTSTSFSVVSTRVGTAVATQAGTATVIHSADLQRWQNSSAGAQRRIAYDGNEYINSTVLNNWDSYVQSNSFNTATIPNEPYADKLRYRQGDYDISTDDGATWTAQPFPFEIVDGQQGTYKFLANANNTDSWHRFTWQASDLSFSAPLYVRIATTYMNPIVYYDLVVESSADGITWTQRNNTQHIQAYTNKRLFVLNLPSTGAWSGDSWARVTIKYTGLTASTATNPINIETIELLTARSGDQGGNTTGYESNLPFSWTGSKDITLQPALSNKIPLTVVAAASTSLSIAAADVSGNTSSVTYAYSSTTQKLVVGQTVTVTGLSISGYNVTLAPITSVATITSGSKYSFTISNGTTGTSTTAGTATISQSQTLQRWVNSSFTALASVAYDGTIYGTTFAHIAAYSNAQLTMGTTGSLIRTSSATTNIALKVQNSTSGTITGDLTQWLNNAGTVIAKVDASGNITAGSMTNGYASSTGTGTYIVPSTVTYLEAAGTPNVVVTLPTSVTGRAIWIRNITASTGTITSNSANIIQKTGGAATSAICPGTSGSFAFLVFTGTNWQIMQTG
jgi:hypothetical protein